MMRWVDNVPGVGDGDSGGGGGGGGESGGEEMLPLFPAPAVVGEGMSLCSVESSAAGEAVLVAFGGYNGACQQEAGPYTSPLFTSI